MSALFLFTDCYYVPAVVYGDEDVHMDRWNQLDIIVTSVHMTFVFYFIENSCSSRIGLDCFCTVAYLEFGLGGGGPVRSIRLRTKGKTRLTQMLCNKLVCRPIFKKGLLLY